MNGGDGRPTMGMYLISLNCALKNGEDGKTKQNKTNKKTDKFKEQQFYSLNI